MSKRTISIQIIWLALMFVAPIAMPYEGETHGLITYQAYNLSGLSQTGQGTIVNRLGLDRLNVSAPFSAYWLAPLPDHGTYYDNAAVSPPQYPSLLDYTREPNSFEQCEMQNLLTAGWINSTDPMVVAGQVTNLPIQNWLLRGVLREDDLTPLGYHLDSGSCGQPDSDPAGDITRVMNHFYDPINDVALTAGCASFGFNGECAKSVDWALGFVDSFAASPIIDTNRRNHFTYEDARENMWLALVGERGRLSSPYTALAHEEDTQERIYRWATVFRSLGDVIHLLQDGAQPQHVRNDKHSPFTSSLEQQAFELYTNGRVLKQTASSQNAYVRGFYSGNQDPQLPRIVTGSYNEVMFATPLRFYTTRLANDGATTLPDGRYGMMDYANRGFFTGGTLPGDTDFLEPPQTIDSAHGYSASTVPCVFSAQLTIVPGVNCVHVTHAVEDNVQLSYVDQLPSGFTAPPVAQLGMLSSIATLFGVAPPHAGYAIGLEEMQTQANLAIPRAIAYSAGLIDYFFRGQLTLSSPPDGLYAVADQGAQHTMNSQGYPCQGTAANDGCAVFGFTTVRVRVKNTTPDIIESGTHADVPQTMAGGRLVAVARYHRNPCYKPDLSGEYVTLPDGSNTVPAGCSIAQTRTAYQEISVSAPLAIDNGGNFPGTNNGSNACANVGNIQTGSTGSCADPGGVLVEFDFTNDPIPINATDLFIQVVYRGPLGQEPDGIAVGTKDILEPNFFSVWNNTDWYLDNGVWTAAPPSPSAYAAEPVTAAITCFNGQLIGGLTTGQQMQPAQFMRAAVLADIQPLQFGAVMAAADGTTYGTDGPTPSVQRQATTEQGTGYAPDPIPYYARGTTVGDEFQQRFRYIGTYTVPQYLAIVNLTPALGSPGTGIPMAVGAVFTSAPETDCAYFFPPPYTMANRATYNHAGDGNAQGGGSATP